MHSVTNLAAATRGEQPDFGAEAPHVHDREAEYAAAADRLHDAWRDPADPDADSRWCTGEIAVHTWDLATALGVGTGGFDPRVAEDGLAFMSGALTPEYRGSMFGPEQPAPAGAGPYERLAALAGRVVPTA